MEHWEKNRKDWKFWSFEGFQLLSSHGRSIESKAPCLACKMQAPIAEWALGKTMQSGFEVKFWKIGKLYQVVSIELQKLGFGVKRKSKWDFSYFSRLSTSPFSSFLRSLASLAQRCRVHPVARPIAVRWRTVEHTANFCPDLEATAAVLWIRRYPISLLFLFFPQIVILFLWL